MTDTFRSSVYDYVELTPERAHELAAKGAAWMDAHCPDWVSHLDLDKLDLSDPEQCVWGQTATCLVPDVTKDHEDCECGPPDYHDVHNHYWRELSEHDLSPSRLGFAAPSFSGDMDTEYEMLNIAWREIIRERLANA